MSKQGKSSTAVSLPEGGWTWVASAELYRRAVNFLITEAVGYKVQEQNQQAEGESWTAAQQWLESAEAWKGERGVTGGERWVIRGICVVFGVNF